MPLSKKDVERHYFDRFRTLCQPFPDGAISSGEEPDFLVAGERRIIGIELTEMHRKVEPGGSPLQAMEAMRHRVAVRAQEIFTRGGNPPVRCTIFFQDVHIEKAQVESLAQAIAHVALHNLPPPNSSLSESFDWVNRSYFPEIIDTISVHRLDAIAKSHFSCPGATWVPRLSSGDIERTLLAKEPKYAAYRKRCDEAWLIVNADIGAMSTWFDFQTDALAGQYVTSFDRVFVMKHFSQALHELRILRSSGF